MDRKCCGDCRYCRKSEDTGEWICSNDLSHSYAMEVEYQYKCEEYKERE